MIATRARSVLQCYRPDGADQGDQHMRKALKAIETDAQMMASFQAQTQFDKLLADSCRALPVPATFVAPPPPTTQSTPWTSAIRQPAFVAAATAGAVILFVALLLILDRIRSFPGSDTIAGMIESSEEVDANDFEPVDKKAGELGDWIFMKYQLERFEVPLEFANLKAVGVRKRVVNDHPIAQIAVGDQGMLLNIFRADDFGVSIEPPGKWKVIKQDNWVAAIRANDGICFMAVFQGTKDDMEKFIAGK